MRKRPNPGAFVLRVGMKVMGRVAIAVANLSVGIVFLFVRRYLASRSSHALEFNL